MNDTIGFRRVLFATILLCFPGVRLLAQGQPGLYDGSWAGVTGQGRSITFVIKNNAMTHIFFAGRVTGSGCTVDFTRAQDFFDANVVQLTGNTFSITSTSTLPGSLNSIVTGSISPTLQATGDLTVTIIPGALSCPGSIGTTWSASLAPGQPVVTGISPSSVAAGEPALALSVTGTGFVSGSTVQWNGTALATNYMIGTLLTATVPASLIATPGSARVTVTNPDATVSNAAAFTITAFVSPAIAAGGVVNGASFQPGIAPNAWVTISGTNLSNVTDTWDKAIVNGKLPIALDGVSVSIGGKPAYVQFVSPGQLNVVSGDLGFGPLPVTVMNSRGTSAVANVTAQQFGPAFFLWTGKFAVATRQDYTYAAKPGLFPGLVTVAAKPGDVIILWGTGFGPTNPPVAAGIQVPSDKLYSTANPVTVMVGDTGALVYGAALAPGFAALYQVAIQIPLSTPDGDIPIKANIGSFQSPNNVFISVQH